MLIRAVGTFGLATLFLLISPALRGSVVDLYHSVEQAVLANSPWSYVAIGVAVLISLMFMLYRASQPRI
jgi:hypothetical protein